MLNAVGISIVTNHVVIDKGASLLNEPSNCKCQIFNWSMVDWATKFCKPEKKNKKETEGK